VVKFLNDIGRGDLKASPGEVAIDDEISMISHSVDDMREKLRTARDELLELNLTLEEKVADRTEELQAAMEELEAMNETLLAANTELENAERLKMMDLDMAANVQKSFLPETPPVSDDYDIDFIFRPAAQVSGDFYDFYFKGSSLHGVGIYDVSGHGISSSLLTIIARSIIQRNFIRGIDEKLNRVMERINTELIEEIGQSDKYITGIMLRFQSDRIEYVNSGHPDAYFRIAGSHKTGKVTNRKGESVKGMFLGVASMEQVYDILSIRLSSGDFLFIYSDCFLEATNIRGEYFGEDGVKRAVATAPEGPAGDVMDHIIKQLNGFVKPGIALSDDLTAMVIKKK
jgi:phosphoserine phosphatase RsbU/P